MHLLSVILLVSISGNSCQRCETLRSRLVRPKILETVILTRFNEADKCDMYQFGFKKGHSTGLCTSVVKQTVDYYLKHGSHVFVCFFRF